MIGPGGYLGSSDGDISRFQFAAFLRFVALRVLQNQWFPGEHRTSTCLVKFEIHMKNSINPTHI